MNVEQLKVRVEQALQSHHQVDAELARVVRDVLAEGATPAQLCAAREMLVKARGIEDVGDRLLRDAERGLSAAPGSTRERWDGYRVAAQAVRNEGSHQAMAWRRIDAALTERIGNRSSCAIASAPPTVPSDLPRRSVGSLMPPP
ncbi:MAG: hypothetical protein ACAI38_15125 [Myxococcota bacterium]|nr:hypothetical protein [Myxococcota bacterium]